MVSVVHVTKGVAQSASLEGRSVRRISAYLVEGDLDHSPKRLSSNLHRAFKGSELQGMGFLFTSAPAGSENNLSVVDDICRSNSNASAHIRQLINGDDLVTNAEHKGPRLAFNISEYDVASAQSKVPELLELARVKVKPERDKLGASPDAKRRREQWWKWSRSTTSLYEAMRRSEMVLATAYTSPQMSFCFVPKDQFFLNTVVLFTGANNGLFSTLQSRIHETWTRSFSSSLAETLRYAPSDCFETFPLPKESGTEKDCLGRRYHEHRAALMVARNEGLTKTYNRVHDRRETAADIQRLRELHADMDRAVLESYGWRDLAERADAVFLDETNEDDYRYQGRLFWPSDFRDEVLARLLALNVERHAEEVRLGIAPSLKSKKLSDDQDDDGDEQQHAGEA